MERVVIVLAVAASTFATRIAGFRLGDRALPPVVDRFLAYVPIAAFAALAAPGIASGAGDLPARLAGVALAALVALRVGQLWAALLAGMGAFWLTGLLAGLG
jgi:branched-subunit amino acid transport protein